MASTVGSFYSNSEGLYYYLSYPSTSSSGAKFTIDPNGGKVYIKSINWITGNYEIVATVTTATSFYRSDFPTSGSGIVELYCTYSRPDYTFTGLTATVGTMSSYRWEINSLKINYSALSSGELKVRMNWQSSGGGGGTTTYTACGKPTSYNIYTTSSGSTTTSSVEAGTNVWFRWSGATSGTNNSISGYSLKIVDDKGSTTYPYVSSTSTSGSYKISTTGLGGHTLSVQVKTCGTAGDSYYSGYTTAKTLTVTSPKVQRTITLNPNGGTVNGASSATVTGYYGSNTILPTPVRPGYKFKGWYTNHNSTKSNVINYGDSYTYSSSISTAFSTYMDDYTITASNANAVSGQTPDGTTIISMTDGCGYSFYVSADGSKVQFDTQTKSGGYNSVSVSTSLVSPGWHDWNCIFDGDHKKLYLYMDGEKVGEASTSWDHINWVPDYGTASSATMNLLVGAEYYWHVSDQIGWANFTGKVGNFYITDSTDRLFVNYNLTTMPDKNITMYARWEKIVYIYDNDNWWTYKPYVYKNSTDGWVPADAYVYNGSAWK